VLGREPLVNVRDLESEFLFLANIIDSSEHFLIFSISFLRLVCVHRGSNSIGCSSLLNPNISSRCAFDREFLFLLCCEIMFVTRANYSRGNESDCNEIYLGCKCEVG
jgi:hypothetical protein